MNPGTRVRFNQNCVWFARIGCEGVVVAPQELGQYPHDPRDKDRVIVLLDDDPLEPPDERGDHPWWTCVTSKASLDVIA